MATRTRKKFECPSCGRLALYSALKTLWGCARRAMRGEAELEAVGPMLCCGKDIPLADFKTLWAMAMNAQRKVHAAGPGRPKSEERCPCGQFTKERAEKRKHLCEAKPARKRKAKVE